MLNVQISTTVFSDKEQNKNNELRFSIIRHFITFVDFNLLQKDINALHISYFLFINIYVHRTLESDFHFTLIKSNII